MTTIADILWHSMEDNYRAMVDAVCERYENDPRYKLRLFHDDGQLTGFSVYYDTPDYRMLEGGYYIGTNVHTATAMWKWITKGAKTMRAVVQKPNTRMITWYKRRGFRVISDDVNNLLFERSV